MEINLFYDWKSPIFWQCPIRYAYNTMRWSDFVVRRLDFDLTCVKQVDLEYRKKKNCNEWHTFLVCNSRNSIRHREAGLLSRSQDK